MKKLQYILLLFLVSLFTTNKAVSAQQIKLSYNCEIDSTNYELINTLDTWKVISPVLVQSYSTNKTVDLYRSAPPIAFIYPLFNVKAIFYYMRNPPIFRYPRGNTHLIISNQEEYNQIKTQNSKDFNFEEDNLFLGVFKIGRYTALTKIKIYLLRSKINNKYIISIVVDNDNRLNCGSRLIDVGKYISFSIPKKYYKNTDKICFKYITCVSLESYMTIEP